MALDKIPNTTLFAQRDVRETPASTATATAVGLTDLNYVLLSTDADTTRDRVLTAGEGIDFTDTGPKGTLTINGEDASDTNKGVASFDLTDFDNASGVISINDSNTVRTVVAGEGIDVTSASGNPTISAEDSTAGNKGIVIVAGTASEISVSYASGTATLSLTNKTSYWSASGDTSLPVNESMNLARANGKATIGASGGNIVIPVNLPNGAVVTGAVVYSNVTDDNWSLHRVDLDAGTSQTLATAALNTEDTSIDNATVDNSTYSYDLRVFNLDNTNEIYSARITYTTDYI